MGIEWSYRGRRPHEACARGVSPYGKWHPESVSIATRRGTRVRVQRRDRFNSGTRERGSDSGRRKASPFSECPRRGAPLFLREGSKPDGRDAARLGSQEPVAAQPHARKRENSPGLDQRTSFRRLNSSARRKVS